VCVARSVLRHLVFALLFAAVLIIAGTTGTIRQPTVTVDGVRIGVLPPRTRP
jgi:hypothetical protein